MSTDRSPRNQRCRRQSTADPRDVAGIDLGSREHWVCAPAGPDGGLRVRTFQTTTGQLHALAEWLLEHGVESVAMESTHVYWVPLYELLESYGLEVLLVNARHLSRVPGRKSDLQDCQWLQWLHSCGLLQGSFRPPESITRLRALQSGQSGEPADALRAVDAAGAAECAGAGRSRICRGDGDGDHLVAGEREPAQLATLRDRRCKHSEAAFVDISAGIGGRSICTP